MSDVDYEFKVIVVGDAGVGKTCMVASFLGNVIPRTYVQTEGLSLFVFTPQYVSQCTVDTGHIYISMNKY